MSFATTTLHGPLFGPTDALKIGPITEKLLLLLVMKKCYILIFVVIGRLKTEYFSVIIS